MNTTPWDDVWINANILTCETNSDEHVGGKLCDAALAVKNGDIAWIGTMADLGQQPQLEGAQVHDAKGCWMSPGLIDCHTHLVYAGNRAKEFEMRLNGASYTDIAKAGGGILSTVSATRAASEDALLEQAAPRLENLMAEGVTTIEIKSGYGLDMQSELKMLRVARKLGEWHPVRVRTTFLAAHALPPEYKDNADGYIAHICEEMLPAAAEAGLVDAVDGFCENIGFSASQMRRVFEVAKRYDLPVKLHAEQLSDQRGAELVAEYGGLSADHIEFLSEAGVKAMAKAGTIATLLPAAFYFLRETQKPPMDLLRKYQVPMAVATDSNPGTAPTESLLLTMNMASTFFSMTVDEVMRGVTANAAKALGLQEKIGSLTVGKRADFVRWGVAEPAELVYRMGVNPCRERVYSGRRSSPELSRSVERR
ncbi:MAG: imidazolonepropionase [Alphaproteobacteria bacterium]|nr:imidazolonepropionase [Alphaproteobacteria bacterium]